METATLTMHRKNGTVVAVSTPFGWVITGTGTSSTMRMHIPRCTCNRHVCPTIHLDGGYSGLPGKPTIASAGRDLSGHGTHGKKHCHGGHVERVRSVIDLIAKTYGPAKKGQ